jgi:iron complex outermembrane receptor protein
MGLSLFSKGKSEAVFFLALILISFLSPGIALPECSGGIRQYMEMSIEELMQIDVESVYTASRYTQNVLEAPSSVTVVTAEEIKRYGYRNLAEVLQSVRGMYISYDRNYHYLGIRGFSRPGDYNSRVLLMIDGHRINDGVFNTSPIGTEFPVNIDLIKKIEIIRGPSSSLYGTNAFFGVINVITSEGAEKEGLQASGEIGSNEYNQERLSYGGSYGGNLALLFSGSYYSSDGRDKLYFSEFDSVITNDGYADDIDHDWAKRLFFKVRYGELDLHAIYSYRKKNVPTATFETVFNDPRYNTVDEYYLFGLKYRHRFAPGTDLSFRINFNIYNNYADYPYDYSEKGDLSEIVINRDVAESEWIGAEVDLTREISETNKLSLGGEFRDDMRQYQKNYDIKTYFDDSRDESSWAFYIQDEMLLGSNVLINAGVRYDDYGKGHDTINPRIALIWSPSRGTSLKLVYGTAFRKPNVYEMYYADEEMTQKGNPDLQAEKIGTYEMVFEQKLNDKLRGHISLYHYRVKNLILLETDPSDGLLVYRNGGEAKAKGLELELDYRNDQGVSGRIFYTYQDATDVQTGERLTNSPLHVGGLLLSYPLVKRRLFLSTELRYAARRKTLSGNWTGDSTLVNMTVYGKRLVKNLDLSFSVYNVLNQKYSHPASSEHIQDSIGQDGRSFRLKITYTF